MHWRKRNKQKLTEVFYCHQQFLRWGAKIQGEAYRRKQGVYHRGFGGGSVDTLVIPAIKAGK